MAQFDIEPTPALVKISDLIAYSDKKIFSIRGGSSASKTYSIITLLILKCLNDEDMSGKLVSIFGQSVPSNRAGAIEDFTNIINNLQLNNFVRYNKTDSTATFPNSSRIQFRSVDKWQKAKGPRRDYLFLNEANNIPYDIASHLMLRTRGTVIFDFNPDVKFWNQTRLLNSQYDEIILTYLDNPYTTIEVKERIESRKYLRDLHGNYVLDSGGDKIVTEWYKVFGLGQYGIVQDMVYPDVYEYQELPDSKDILCGIGLDFGYTNQCAATFVSLDCENRALYSEEIFYETGLSDEEIADRLLRFSKRKGISPFVIGDSEDPKSVNALRRFGVDAYSTGENGEGGKSLQRFLRMSGGYVFAYHKDSTNLKAEQEGYKFVRNQFTNEFKDVPQTQGVRHLLDAKRYISTYLIYQHLSYHVANSLSL